MLQHGLSKKCVSALVTVLMITIHFGSAHGQSTETPYVNDTAKQRLLIHITAHYLHTASQGQIDMDSAIRIPCKVYKLNPLLAYNEGYSSGKQSAGSMLLGLGNIKEATALLPGLHGEARLQLLLELCTYFVFKPGTEKNDLNLADKYINEAMALSETISDKWKIESQILKAHLLHQSGLGDESQEIFDQTIQLCERTGNTMALARVLLSAGKLLHYGHPSRLSKFEKARSIFKTLHAKEKEIETGSEITIEHFAFKRYDLAKQFALKSVELEKEINYHHLQYAYAALSYMAMQTGDAVGAFSYSNKCLESVTTRADSVFISLFLNQRAGMFFSISKDDEAMAFYDKALENKTEETRLYWYKAFISKVEGLNILNRSEEALVLLKETGSEFPPISIFEKMYFAKVIGETYERQRKFDLAEDNYNVFLTLAENFPVEYIHNEFSNAFSTISDFYRRLGKTDKARALLNRVKPIFFDARADGKAQYYSYLFKIDSTDKKYLEAIKDLQLSQVFYDSSLTHDQKKNVDELLVKYETDKKDKNIQLLKQQTELQDARLQQSQFTQRMSIAGAGLFLVIAGLLYYLYRTKQKSNTQLKHLLTEKEWLLKEVHHRVKNNLQTVLSLLESQSRRLLGNEALHAIQESQNRVYAMSLIHKKLYQSTNVASINMEDYLRDLIQHLRESFGQSGSIQFSLGLEPINLDVSQAVPVGLVVNEAITNSIKYAFSEKSHNSEIFVSLKTAGDKVDLTISDNGVGMTQTEKEKPQHLGLKLMKGLTEDIDGFFTMNTEHGVSIQVLFVPNVPLQKVNAEVLLTHELRSA